LVEIPSLFGLDCRFTLTVEQRPFQRHHFHLCTLVINCFYSHVKISPSHSGDIEVNGQTDAQTHAQPAVQPENITPPASVCCGGTKRVMTWLEFGQ